MNDARHLHHPPATPAPLPVLTPPQRPESYLPDKQSLISVPQNTGAIQTAETAVGDVSAQGGDPINLAS